MPATQRDRRRLPPGRGNQRYRAAKLDRSAALDRGVAGLRIQLSEDAFNAARADGRAMTLGQTVAFARDAMPLPSSAAVEEAHAQPQPDTPSQAAQGGSFSRQNPTSYTFSQRRRPVFLPTDAEPRIRFVRVRRQVTTPATAAHEPIRAGARPGQANFATGAS